MKIGEAAKETGLSISNIRFYEKRDFWSRKEKRRADTGIIHKKIFCG